MTRAPLRDLLVGLFVLAGLGAIAYLSLSVGGLSARGPGGLMVFADFDEIGGLKPRAQVVISGVKVGQVASIATSGLLGDRYVSLQLGGEPETLKPGDRIAMTESAVVLERLIGKLVYGGDRGKTE